MKKLKKLLKILLVLLVLIGLGSWAYLRSFQPTYSGTIDLEDIKAPVAVYYDVDGVPHIEAGSQEDAYIALGYVHAQDRLWQMELMRRLAAGRLSELFGKKLLPTDVFFSGLGIEENAVKTIAELDKNSPQFLMATAYLKGVNQYIKNGTTPIEYILVGAEKEPFTLKDMYNVFGYMSFSFAVAHKTDPLLNEIKETLGEDYLAELGIPVSENTALLKSTPPKEITAAFSRAVNALYENLPISPFIGSNSWVIGPEKTKNGKVIFANDPHISYSQPSVWYQSHIKTPDYEMYGFNLALTPFSLLGHNRDYAYGLTMFENDDIDFYIEEENPENPLEYKTPTGYSKYELIDKTIKIKDAPDTTYQVKVSVHGPIMNGIIAHLDDERPIAMQWIFTKLPNKLMDVSYKISHATSLETFIEGVEILHAPGLNIMYGDAKNTIAWFAAGQLYTYREGVNTKTYLNGASGDDEILELIPFKENPQAINPSWNYVYSANNQPDTIAGHFYPGYYLPEDRGLRIVQLLDAKNDFTKEDVASMIFDVTSSVAPSVVQNLLEEVAVKKLSDQEQLAYAILADWDGAYLKNTAAPTIYNRFIYEFLKATFKDELGKGFDQFLNTPLQKKMIAVQAAKDESVWWDNITTEKKETKKEIIQGAFAHAVSFIEKQLGGSPSEWTWSKVTSVEHKHPLGEVAALRSYFNVGPFEIDGGNAVINNNIFDLNESGYYTVKAGPSTRRVIDFSDIENSLSILPTGQSGNVFSDHYKDQAQKYINGEFNTMIISEEGYRGSPHKVTFTPAKK